MSSHRSLAELAARALREDSQQADPVPPPERVQVIDAMVSAMRRRKRGRRAGIAASVTVALAASAVLAVGAHRSTEGRPSHDEPRVAVLAAPAAPAASAVLHGRASVVRAGAPVSEREALAAGDRIDVPAGASAIVSLANGTEVSGGAGTSYLLLAFAPATTFELAAGSIHADVAKLAPDERFLVRTADAEIEVRGTSFDVSRVVADASCGDGTTTRVAVREGTVLVRSRGTEALVHANEVWPAGCSATPAPSSLAPPSSNASNAASSERRASPSGGSDLGAQNDLFERAIARKRAGDGPGAIASFELFLARYPASHLAQSARAERMKLLRGVDREKGRAAARDYLQHHPSGFARADADVILASP